MTQDTNSQTDSRIDRRTVLSLVGGGMTALSGCIGGSGSTSENSTASQTETTSTLEESGPVESISFMATEMNNYPTIAAVTEFAEDTSVKEVQLLSEGDVLAKTGAAGSGELGESKAVLPLVNISMDSRRISPTGNKLVFSTDNGQSELEFTYRTSIVFKRLVRPKNSSFEEFTPDEQGISAGPHVGVVLENKGDKPGYIDWFNTYHAPKSRKDSVVNKRLPGKAATNPVVEANSEYLFPLEHFLFQHMRCGTEETQEAKIRLARAFGDDIAVKVPVKYEKSGSQCKTTLAGEARTVAPGTTKQTTDN